MSVEKSPKIISVTGARSGVGGVKEKKEGRRTPVSLGINRLRSVI